MTRSAQYSIRFWSLAHLSTLFPAVQIDHSSAGAFCCNVRNFQSLHPVIMSRIPLHFDGYNPVNQITKPDGGMSVGLKVFSHHFSKIFLLKIWSSWNVDSRPKQMSIHHDLLFPSIRYLSSAFAGVGCAQSLCCGLPSAPNRQCSRLPMLFCISSRCAFLWSEFPVQRAPYECRAQPGRARI
jgi:hypothetical protein